MTPTLDGVDISGKHTCLAEHRPDWSSTGAAIRNEGGPWGCPTCGTASFLIYRCSACGAELSGG